MIRGPGISVLAKPLLKRESDKKSIGDMYTYNVQVGQKICKLETGCGESKQQGMARVKQRRGSKERRIKTQHAISQVRVKAYETCKRK